MSNKPTVYLAVRVQPTNFDLSSLTANLGHVRPPMECHEEVIAPVAARLVTNDMALRVRLKSKGGPVIASLLAWSSSFDDDQSTPVDERWLVIDKTPIATDQVIELKGRFDPYRAQP
jgi:hypothetical protein